MAGTDFPGGRRSGTNGSAGSSNHMSDTWLVTVTYGSRSQLLSRALASAFDEGLSHAVVVDNASSVPVGELMTGIFGSRVSVITLPRNTGSANGYSTALKEAYLQGAEYIVLLDDDNVFNAGSLAKLRSAYEQAGQSIPKEHLTVVGMRPGHQHDVLRGIACELINPKPDSFFGFHLLDIPGKIRRILSGHADSAKLAELPALVRLDVVPYSGMLFRRELLERHGYPDARMVLYGDDTEFSYRVTRAGGSNLLVTDALISDLEASWNERTEYVSSFRTWLCGPGDFRAYYSGRNGAYFEHHVRPHNPRIRAINRSAYLLLLRIASVRLGKGPRYRMLREAIADGESGRLGMSSDYVLR